MGLFSSITGGVLGLLGGDSKAKAAKQGAAAQTAALQQGIDTISAQNSATQANFQPYLSTGASATSAIADLLGLGGTAAHQAATQPQALTTPNYAAYVQNNPDLLALYQSGQGQARGKTMEQFGQEHWQNYGQGENRPFTPTTNPQATAPQATGDPISGQQAQQSAIDQLKASPLFQSLFRTGQEAIDQNASATGGLRGGNVQSSLANFGSDTLAKVIQQQLSNLGGLSGQGLSAAGTSGQLGASAAGSVANLFGAQGQAQAGGILNASAAKAGGLGSLINGIGDVGKTLTSGQGGILGSIGKILF